jgi:hypothetical protein
MIRLAVLLAVLFVVGCGGGSLDDRSSQVASDIQADSCTATRYYLIMRDNQEKVLIYDCQKNGRTYCVTEQNGIASDSTELARAVFADSLTGKPSCVT